MRRGFVLQCVANHINPFPHLPGYEDHPAPVCPYCERTVNAELEAAEDARLEAATADKRNDIRLEHRKTHAGGQLRLARSFRKLILSLSYTNPTRTPSTLNHVSSPPVWRRLVWLTSTWFFLLRPLFLFGGV